jgi:hypothetical protein
VRAYVDDVTIHAQTLEAAVAAFNVIQRHAARLDMRVRVEKCELLSANNVPDDVLRGVPRRRVLKLLGASVGFTNADERVHLEERARVQEGQLRTLCRRLALTPCPWAVRALAAVAVTKPIFMLRTHAPEVTLPLARRLDAICERTWIVWAGCDDDPGDLPRALAKLPLRDGGLGFTRAEDIAAAAYEASVGFVFHDPSTNVANLTQRQRCAPIHAAAADLVDGYGDAVQQHRRHDRETLSHSLWQNCAHRAHQEAFRAALRQKLLAPPRGAPARVQCACGSLFNFAPEFYMHAPSCTHVRGFNAASRHTAVKDALKALLAELTVRFDQQEPRNTHNCRCPGCETNIGMVPFDVHMRECRRYNPATMPRPRAHGPDVRIYGLPRADGCNDTVIDITVVNVVAPSRAGQTVQALFRAAEQRKRAEYAGTCVAAQSELRAFVASAYGVLAPDATRLLAQALELQAAPFRTIAMSLLTAQSRIAAAVREGTGGCVLSAERGAGIAVPTVEHLLHMVRAAPPAPVGRALALIPIAVPNADDAPARTPPQSRDAQGATAGRDAAPTTPQQRSGSRNPPAWTDVVEAIDSDDAPDSPMPASNSALASDARGGDAADSLAVRAPAGNARPQQLPAPRTNASNAAAASSTAAAANEASSPDPRAPVEEQTGDADADAAPRQSTSSADTDSPVPSEPVLIAAPQPQQPPQQPQRRPPSPPLQQQQQQQQRNENERWYARAGSVELSNVDLQVLFPNLSADHACASAWLRRWALGACEVDDPWVRACFVVATLHRVRLRRRMPRMHATEVAAIVGPVWLQRLAQQPCAPMHCGAVSMVIKAVWAVVGLVDEDDDILAPTAMNNAMVQRLRQSAREQAARHPALRVASPPGTSRRRQRAGNETSDALSPPRSTNDAASPSPSRAGGGATTTTSAVPSSALLHDSSQSRSTAAVQDQAADRPAWRLRARSVELVPGYCGDYIVSHAQSTLEQLQHWARSLAPLAPQWNLIRHVLCVRVNLAKQGHRGPAAAAAIQAALRSAPEFAAWHPIVPRFASEGRVLLRLFGIVDDGDNLAVSNEACENMLQVALQRASALPSTVHQSSPRHQPPQQQRGSNNDDYEDESDEARRLRAGARCHQ